MSKPVAAALDHLLPAIEAQLAASYTVLDVADDGTPPGAEACEARALITSGGKGASAALIGALPKLEIIAVNGVGYDAVDMDAARSRGIRVTNTPDVLTDDVADMAIGLIIAVYRGLYRSEAYLRAGDWAADRPLPFGRTASGRRLGIVGLGRIGKAIARRAEPMMASIAYTGRTRQATPYAYYPDAEALAAAVDILVVIVPGNGGTERLIDRRVLDALGPEGVLINVARGSVVDEPALIDALRSGRLGGAGLDVFADEPNVPAAFLGLDNVVLQPHRGSATIETRTAMGQLVVDNLAAHFAGRPLPTPVA